MQIVAVNWQIYVLLKGSTFAIDVLGQHIPLDAKALGLGTLGLVRIIPIIAFALFGGMIADTQDRRTVMIWTQLPYFFFALTGAADTVSTVIRGTLRQLLTPDALRGRMVSVNMIFFMGGPQLGELEAGVVAAAFGTPFSIVSGGVITVLMAAWVAWRYAQLRNFTSDAYAT
jgi:hypothetical protein